MGQVYVIGDRTDPCHWEPAFKIRWREPRKPFLYPKGPFTFAVELVGIPGPIGKAITTELT